MKEPPRLWRICKAKYAQSAFSGQGSFLYAGRWNPPGVRVVYTSTSLALAALETFVHLDPRDEPETLVSVSAILPAKASLKTLDLATLPGDWASLRAASAQAIGSEWVRSGRSLALEVPSVAVPGEWNVLLNPVHRQFHEITIEAAQPWHFDPRMFQR